MISSTIPVIAGEVYRVYVGGAGSNTAGGFNGGGLSLCVASDFLCNRSFIVFFNISLLKNLSPHF